MQPCYKGVCINAVAIAVDVCGVSIACHDAAVRIFCAAIACAQRYISPVVL